MVKIELILACLMLAALAGIPIGLFSAIIKKIKGKPAKTSLKLAGISIVVFMAVTFIYPETPEEPSGTDKDQVEAVSGMDNISVPEETGHDTSEEFEDKPEELENEDSDSKQGTGHSEEEEYIGDELLLDEATDFSEGRAWVQYNVMEKEKGSAEAFADGFDAAMGDDLDRVQYWAENYGLRGNKAAVIDTNGKILWESEATENDIVLEEASEFRDGLAYCKFNGNDKSTYIIVDSEGSTVFTRDFDDDFIILGHGGGLVLAAEHISDFSSDEWKIGAIDKNGDIAVPFQVYENKPYAGLESVEPPSGEAPDPNYDYDGYLEYQTQLEAYEEYERNSSISYPLSFDYYDSDGPCEYFGDGVFRLSCSEWNVLLNIKIQSIIYSSDRYNMGGQISAFISNFKDGAAAVICEDENGQSVCSLKTDGTLAQIASNDWTRYNLSSNMKFGDGLVFVSDSGIDHEITGRVIEENMTTGAYYNTVGEKVIDFPEYNDKNLYYCGSPFQNGYAVMFIEGADGYLYTTVINKKGEKMFEPKTGFNPVYMSGDGKYLTAVRSGFLTVFNVKGKPLVDIKCSRIDPEYGFEYIVHDGMIKIHSGSVTKYFYVNMKDGAVIGMYGDTKDTVKVY